MCYLHGEGRKDRHDAPLANWACHAPFTEATCGHPECLKEYERGLEIGYELAKEDIEDTYFEEDILNG